MKKTLLLLLVVPLLMGAGCTSKNVEEDKPLDTNQVEDTKDADTTKKDTKKDTTVVAVDVDYVLYENKAMGYTIMRPDNWYWQHFMKNNLTAAGTNELIDDYFISDKNALIGLGSEYLGQIVIEKSRFDLEELKKNMTGYASKQITVAGQPATRFEIQTNENKMIEYHFEKGEQTFRLMYVSSDLPQNQSIFEAVVKSFTFVE